MVMSIDLKKKPKKGATIIEGFPGFGLVSTIATEFLIEHLDAKSIGRIRSENISPLVALHKGELLEPFGIFYAEKENIVIIRGISPVKKIEWDVARALIKFSKDIKAKEIISIEGVSSDGKPPEPEAFYYSTTKARSNKFDSIGLKKLDEGVIVGVTAGLLSALPDLTCVFAEAYSNLPDSRAAAKIVEVLDGYLGLKIDFKPLLKKAEVFEKKIKSVLGQVNQGIKLAKKKDDQIPESYFG